MWLIARCGFPTTHQHPRCPQPRPSGAQVKVPALNPETKSEEEAGGKDDGKPSDGVHLRELQGLLYEIEDVGFRVCRG